MAAAGQLLLLAYAHWPQLVSVDPSSTRSLEQLATSLQAACEAAVQQVQQLRGPGPAADQLLQQSDPQHCCWLRDAVQLWVGPLLCLQALLAAQRQAARAPAAAAAAAAAAAGSPPGSSSSSSPSCGVDCQEFVCCLLRLLTQRLLSCLSSSSYEVKAAALKAAAVVLGKVTALQPLVPELLLLPPGNTAGAATAATSLGLASLLEQLEGRVWTLLECERTGKVLKRLLTCCWAAAAALQPPAAAAAAGTGYHSKWQQS